MISGWRASDASTASPVVGGPSAAVPTIQSFAFGSLPSGAPGTVQPSIVSPSSSNEVEPWPPGPAMSSTNDAGRLDDVVAGVADRDLDWPPA